MDKKTVLFVDDDPCVLQTLKLGLMGESYDQLYAISGPKALAIMETQPVHVIVSDLRMPEMSGLELLRVVKDKWPFTVRMVLSGYAHITTLMSAINQGHIFKFIMKPWAVEDDFKPSIHEALLFYDTQFEHETVGSERAEDRGDEDG